MDSILDWRGLPGVVVVVVVCLLARPSGWRDWVKCGLAVIVIAFSIGWSRAQAHREGRCELLREIADGLGVPHDGCNLIRVGEFT